MADVSETVKLLTVKASASGVDQTKNQLRDLVNATQDVTNRLGDAAKAQLSLATQSASTGQKLLVFAGSIAAVGLAVSAMTDYVQKVASGMADLSKAARTAGIDLDKFQRLQFAAAVGGVSSEKFAEGTASLAKNINDALRSENDFSKLLDANNVKWKDGNRAILSTTQLLDTARDLISRAANEQDKIKVAEMLGLTKEWVVALDKSADEWRNLQQEASALGLVIDQETIQRAERFHEEWRKAGLVFSTWIAAQISDLFPLLEDLIQKAKDFGSNLAASAQQAINSPNASRAAMLTEMASEALQEAAGEENAARQTELLKDAWNLTVSAGKALAGTLSENARELLDFEIAARKAAAAANVFVGPDIRFAGITNNVGPQKWPGWTPPNPTKIPIGGKDDKEDKTAMWDRETKAIEKHTAGLLADKAAVFLSEGEHAALRAELQLLRAAKEDDLGVTKQQIERYSDLRATMSAQKALDAAGINSLGERKDKLLELADAARRAQQDLSLLKNIKDLGVSFAQDFAHGMMQGKSAIDALTGSLTQLATKLADKAIVDLISGNYVQAAVEGIGAVVSFIVGHNSEKKKQEQQARDAANQRVTQFVIERQIASQNQNTLEGALAAFDVQAQQKRVDEVRAGGQAMVALEQDLTVQRANIIRDFAKRAADAEAQLAADRLAKIEDFNRAFNAAKGEDFLNQVGDLFKQMADFNTAGVDLSKTNELLQIDVQKIVDDAGLTGEAFNHLIDVFPQLTGVIHETTKATQDQIAAEQARTSAARSVVDYINGLVSGPNATVSPQARLSNAQQVYDANLALARQGNVDATSKFAELADNLEKAARAFYGSSANYQHTRSALIADALTLPAVAESTDPVVVAIRDAITAIQVAGANTVVSIGDMRGTLKAAIDSGSAAATALALSTYFNQLDTNVNNLLDFGEFVSGLGQAGLVTNTNLSASDTQTRDKLQTIFNELDTNGDGQISRLELVAAATNNVAISTDQVKQLQASTNQLIDAANQTGLAAKGVLDSINALTVQLVGLNSTSTAQLDLLTSQLTGTGTIPQPQQWQNAQSGIALSDVQYNNNAITALNKIVYNTAVIAFNVASLARGEFNEIGYVGKFARGGVIPAGGLGLVSEHSPGGGRFIRAPLTESITVSPFGAANDNGAVVRRIEMLERAFMRGLAQLAEIANDGNNANREGHAMTAGAVNGQTRALQSDTRQDRANPQRRAG